MRDITEVCEAVVAVIKANVEPPELAEVSREYLAPVKFDTIVGRKVYVFAADYSSPGPANRQQDICDYLVAVIVIERYADAGPVPKEWIDDRVRFVKEKVWDKLTNARDSLLLNTLWPQEASAEVYDINELSRNKTFWSEVEILFREEATP